MDESPYNEVWIGIIKISGLDPDFKNVMETSPELEKFIDEESKKHSKEDQDKY